MNKSSDLEFIEAVRTSQSWKEVKDKLGHSRLSGQSYKKRCDKLNLQYDHFSTKFVKVSDAQLIDALKVSKNILGATRELGLPASMTYYNRIRRLIKNNPALLNELPEDICNRLRGNDRLRDSPELRDAIATSYSYMEVARKLGHLENDTRPIRRIVEKIGIDTSHFRSYAHNKGKKVGGIPLFPLEQILCENSTYNRTKLKSRLIEAGLLINRCYICDCEPTWQGQRLVLRLDHMNGVNNDNRLENLRLLCPNCDSQTDTFTGRNKKN